MLFKKKHENHVYIHSIYLSPTGYLQTIERITVTYTKYDYRNSKGEKTPEKTRDGTVKIVQFFSELSQKWEKMVGLQVKAIYDLCNSQGRSDIVDARKAHYMRKWFSWKTILIKRHSCPHLEREA